MKVSILGSTGSIGTQSLAVVDDLKGGDFEVAVTALCGGRNIDLLEKQIRKYHPKLAAVADEKLAETLKIKVADTSTQILSGVEGVCCVASEPSSDMVLSAISGFDGLRPTVCAIDSGKDIALANKETLVAAGRLVMQKIRDRGVRLLPVDSEHCAIFQCLHCGDHGQVKRLLLTASGGPFFGKTKEELSDITVEQALNHPNWNMGSKITIDSATLMNKGLEVIEAKWLFDVDIDEVYPIIHRESIVHSMVEFCDNSVIAQLSVPSMKHPIQYAFTYPHRTVSYDEALDLTKLSALTFYEPDEDVFPCLKIAKEAGRQDGIMPVVLNAANEVAVAAFMKRRIKFLQISEIVGNILGQTMNKAEPSMDEIIEADCETRRKTQEYISAEL